MPGRITVRLDRVLGTISPRIYGHFAEHLGRCMYGGLWVGPRSKIPNVKGFRTDAIRALKRLRAPVIRWPGGCFADDYDWRDGIGPRPKRPKRVNLWWGSDEPNQVGTHEFLTLCELVGADPYISVNVGSGTPRQARDWVEYCNRAAGTTLSDLRARNGRKKPWDIVLWGAGNEPWLCGGNFTAEEYGGRFRQYATFMKQIDPRIELVACGSIPEKLLATRDHAGWDRRVLGAMDPVLPEYLAIHHFLTYGHATQFADSDHYGLMSGVVGLEDHILGVIKIAKHYESKKKVRIVIDEWAVHHENALRKEGYFQQHTLRDAIAAGLAYNVYNRLCDWVSMSNLTQTANVLQSIFLTKGSRMILTPTYHVLDLYRPHMGAEAVVAEVRCPTCRVDGPAGKKIVLPLLSVSASRSGNDLTLSVVNQHLTRSAEMQIAIRSDGDVAGGEVSVLTAPDVRDHNDFGRGEGRRVAPVKKRVDCAGKSFSRVFEAKSVTVMRLNLA